MLADTADVRFMISAAVQWSRPWGTQAQCLRHYLATVNASLYVPSAYLHCGIKGANGSLRHYGAAADVRDALALELL